MNEGTIIYIIVKTSDANDAYDQYTTMLSSNKSNISLHGSTLRCGGACAVRPAHVSQGMSRHSVLHKAQFACCFSLSPHVQYGVLAGVSA